MNERERLVKIIESEGLTARQFAAEIGVSAGTISNILGGRNNASLEIMTKILNRFRTISADWLILGTGTMYRPNGGVTQTAVFGDLRPEVDCLPADELSSATVPAQVLPTAQVPASRTIAPKPVQKQIARIIVYYTDGTYEER